MALVGDMSQLEQNTFIAEIYRQSGITSESQFIFLVGLCVLGLLFASMIISIFTIWGLSMFANKIGTEIADRLYTYYLNQDWLFHASGSSAQLTKKIATETMRVTGAVLVPLMQMNSKVTLSLLMSISIFLYDPKVALIGLSIFAISYFFLFKGFRNKLNKNGIAISEVNEERFRLMNEGFGGIKDLLLTGRDNDFIDRFNKSGKTLAYSQGTNAALANAPRYFVELLAFGSMIVLILYLIASHNGNLGMILPILSVYAIGIIKLLPAFHKFYSVWAKIKPNIPSI
jgi:ABC-type multidrug transport system, ATPase and permease components